MKEQHITRVTLEEAMALEDKTDWERLRNMTDEEIEAQIADDPDWAGMEIDWSKAVMVEPQTKQAVSIRLDRDVIDFFKAQGKGYQTRINSVLRAYMRAKKSG